MKRMIKKTEDGSHTLFIEDWHEGYHSHHGAISESQHVYIKNGFNMVSTNKFTILELGFGTGLNALLTYVQSSIQNKKVTYITIEKYPIDNEEVLQLNYPELLDKNLKEKFLQLHHLPWGKTHTLALNFSFTKYMSNFFLINTLHLPKIDLVYFDCFGSRVQPELWELPLLEMVSNRMSPNGIFTTYSSKGSLRRNLTSLGFIVEKRAGPKGKREMIVAWKK